MMGIGLHQGRFYGFVIHQIMKVAHNNIYIFHITSCIKTKKQQVYENQKQGEWER